MYLRYMTEIKVQSYIKEYRKIENNPSLRKLALSLRRRIFSDMLESGLRDWYAKPEGLNLTAIELWLLVCKYDREKNTGTIWGTSDHASSIMAELHVGMHFKVSNEYLKEWQETIAAHGYGDNTGSDWISRWTRLNKDIEVKLLSYKNSSAIAVDKTCDSYYIFVSGSVDDFQFRIVGRRSQTKIENCPKFLYRGLVFYRVEFTLS